MSELALLFVFVVALYLLQCICWAPVRATVFRAGVFREGKRARHGFQWNALRSTGFWSNPLPLEALLVVSWPAASLSADGIELEGHAAPVPWNHLALRHAGARLLCNDVPVLHAPAVQINEFQQLLQRVAGAKPRARARIIEQWLRKATDVKAAEQRLQQFRARARFMAMLTWLQLLLLFVVAPWWFSRFGARAIWMALAVVLAASVSITIEFWLLHRSFYPQARDSRLTSAVTILLSPISAIRALDGVGRDLLAGFHPVAAAAVLCSQAEFAAFAGEQLRELSFSPGAATWYGERLKDGLGQVITEKGLNAKELMSAPERQEECAFYCPRCLAQYLAARAECADCGYEGLVRF